MLERIFEHGQGLGDLGPLQMQARHIEGKGSVGAIQVEGTLVVFHGSLRVRVSRQVGRGNSGHGLNPPIGSMRELRLSDRFKVSPRCQGCGGPGPHQYGDTKSLGYEKT